MRSLTLPVADGLAGSAFFLPLELYTPIFVHGLLDVCTLHTACTSVRVCLNEWVWTLLLRERWMGFYASVYTEISV